jgi:hypothetical protein
MRRFILAADNTFVAGVDFSSRAAPMLLTRTLG